MNRHEFMEQLKRKLRKLPFDEIKEAVEYYEQYFDDAGAENEQEVLGELGSASEVAAQIIAGFAVKGVGAEESAKAKWNTAWLVVLASLATPIALPLTLVAGALALTLIITMSAVIFSFFMAGVAMLAGGAVCAFASFFVIAESFSTTLFALGLGLTTSGAGLAVVIATANLSKKCFGWLAKQVGGFILRGSKK